MILTRTRTRTLTLTITLTLTLIRRALGRGGLGDAEEVAAEAEAEKRLERAQMVGSDATDAVSESEVAAEADERGAYRRARLRRVSGQVGSP